MERRNIKRRKIQDLHEIGYTEKEFRADEEAFYESEMLSDEQKKRLTDWVFSQADIISKLEESETSDPRHEIKTWKEYLEYKKERRGRGE